jgi:hypothetical protein
MVGAARKGQQGYLLREMTILDRIRLTVVLSDLTWHSVDRKARGSSVRAAGFCLFHHGQHLGLVRQGMNMIN